jgi:hypothetical protein
VQKLKACSPRSGQHRNLWAQASGGRLRDQPFLFHGRSDIGTIGFRFRNFFGLLGLKSQRGQRPVDFHFPRRNAAELGWFRWEQM